MRPGEKNPRLRLAALYFLLQGLLGAAWWLAVFSSQSVREAFWPSATADHVLHAFALADGALFVGGSLLTAALVATHQSAAKPMSWVTAGVAGYAFLYCVGQWWASGEAALAAVAMGLAVSGSTVAAVSCK